MFAVIDSTCTIHEKETLTKQLQALLGVDAPKPKASIPGFIRLKDLVRKEQIKTHRPVKSWNEAVALAARPLLDQGWMTLDYYNEILDLSVRYEQFGVILAPLCAPHANADVRNHPCISIVTTKEPVTVSMGSVEMPIRVVMLLCLQTPVSLSSALDELFRLVDEEPNFITDLIEATTATKLQHVLEGYCERMDKR